MHTLKGCWNGQTFALTKYNESDSGSGASSRKSRIRRSKEERKSMIESFIKKYQSHNRGGFPSLNLTHKEVGGSFYTVREIFREIIQENRLLGPAKFTDKEKMSNDRFLQEYPLGSIATETQVLGPLSTIETQSKLVSSLDDVDGDERVELSSEKHRSDKQMQIVNGSEVELNICEPVETMETENVDELVASTSKVIDLANIEVETFPVASVPETPNGSLETLGGSEGSVEILDWKPKADVNSRSVGGITELYGSSFSEKYAFANDVAGKNQTAELADPPVESSDNSVTKDGIVNGAKIAKSFSDEAYPHDTLNSKKSEDVKVQAIKAPNGALNKNLYGSVRKTEAVSSFVELKIKATPEAQSKRSVSRESSSSPPLDRINLESWEVSSNASRKETSLLLAIFKALVASFVKFWTQ